MGDLSTLDMAVLACYLAGITAWGAWLGRGYSTGSDYFLGSRNLPWAAVLLSVVATETSTLTFLSIPGVAYSGSLVFLQVAAGYCAGRIAVALLFLPAYFRGELTTAYGLLEARFGAGTRRFASATFMATRLMADSVRLFATAIPLALITGWPYPASIVAIGVLTMVYTYFGGLRAVVWVDSVQMLLYLFGAAVALAVIGGSVPGGWSEVLGSAAVAGKLQVLDLSWDLGTSYTLWAGLIGGCVFSMASHGADQLIVQRLLACRSVRDSQAALVGSGLAVAAQFLVFLLVGIGLWAFYAGQTFERPDEIFARFIVSELPRGIRGLLIAGVFAAAMSSLSSSINSLASSSAYDFWAPLAGWDQDDRRLLRAGRVFTLGWSLLLVAGAVAFIPLSRGTSAVEVALGIAAVVYGGLLGAFALGVSTALPGQRAAVLGIAAGVAAVASLQGSVSWLWYVPIGSVVTFGTGCVLGFAKKRA
ncbi:MAG: sodium:solute symporter [Bryobacterales bacterium]|nr:sodium:solute symporter [Bryobacterales bacterium]